MKIDIFLLLSSREKKKKKKTQNKTTTKKTPRFQTTATKDHNTANRYLFACVGSCLLSVKRNKTRYACTVKSQLARESISNHLLHYPSKISSNSGEENQPAATEAAGGGRQLRAWLTALPFIIKGVQTSMCPHICLKLRGQQKHLFDLRVKGHPIF